MENPRPEKVAVVEEVRGRFESAGATLLTEYRGIDVAAMAELRRAISAAGGRYKIYKNTLVRFAANDLGLDIGEWLTGPTAIAFVESDPVAVAKALRDFARTNPALVVKGGLLGTKHLSADDARALADIAPRDELLARLAGAMAAPMQQLAGLLQALPGNFAYGLKALIDERDASGAPVEPTTPDEPPPGADGGVTTPAAIAEPAAEAELAVVDPTDEAEAGTTTADDDNPPADTATSEEN